MEGAIVLGLAVNHGNKGIVRIIPCGNQWRVAWNALDMSCSGCISEMWSIADSPDEAVKQLNGSLTVTPFFPEVEEEGEDETGIRVVEGVL